MADLAIVLDRILAGFWVTVTVTVFGALLALVVSFVAGLMALSRRRAVYGTSRGFVEFFRGTSLLVQLFWWYFVLPFLGIRLEIVAAGVVALGLNYGAYGSEVVRGAILAIPKTQFESTVALSMTPLQRMRLVLLPQAIVGMIPPFTNLLVQLLKGSALVALIGLSDMTFMANQARDETGSTVLSFGTVLVIYFLLSQLLVLGMRFWERQAKKRIGENQPLVSRLRAERVPEGGAL